MLCCLAFGEHEAPKRDLKRVGIAIPAEGKPTIPLRLYPTDSRDVITPPPRPFGRSKMFSWLAFGEHEALKRDLKRVGFLILAEGKPTIPFSSLPHGPSCNEPPPLPLGRPNNSFAG